jgi:predicted transposase YdaD
MREGGRSSIIARWLAEGERRLIDEGDRADLGAVTLVFAALAGCRPAWAQALRGWNVKTSPFLDEIRAEGREKGREEGRVEGARALVLRLGRQKFRKTPTRKQQKALEEITDIDQLVILANRLLEVGSWAELIDKV